MKRNTLLALCSLLLFSACSKVDYTEINNPAYLRVFNDLNLKVGLENKDEGQPFLTMLIDPVLGADSVPVSAKIKGDFLDLREPYAPPYPSHIGSNTSLKNPEYPGKENVLVGPVLNGFDLSSWAQVPAGTHRVMFLYRPLNDVPFFNLETSLKKKVLIDTVITLDSREVYTMEVLQRDFTTKQTGILLRQENFQKLPLADSLVYVNFYNYSADGFWQADNTLKKDQFSSGMLQYGMRDRMNIFLSVCKPGGLNTLPGYKFNYMNTVIRNTASTAVAQYYSFPVFADPAEATSTNVWQRFTLLEPGIEPDNNPYGDGLQTYGQYALISCIGNGTKASFDGGSLALPNMIVNIHSGKDNPRSFATVNTIEVINGNAYLMTVQRKYPPPIY